jgi:steroid delta-isomerase-like uncharacterized protein
MSAKDNERIARAIFDAFNNRKIDDAMKLVADRAEYRDVPTGEVYRGPDGTRKFMEGWLQAFDDAKVNVQRVIATDQLVVTEFVGRGTHTGPLETPAGTIRATNNRIDVPFCEVVEIRDGKMVSGSIYYDAATMMQQLGITEPASAHR